MLIAFCLLVALASAQPYSIRANRGLNLRTEPSLTADIADTVPSGSILQVVGKLNRWLKIDRNGREVWLADWVNFSRVDESAAAPNPQPASAAPANVDNCCFVDRQCQSDAEWEAGYWAYQNRQCAAPAQLQPVPPAQPVASTPSRPQIEGSVRFVARVEAALDLMQRSAPEWYDYVSRYVDLIREVPDTYPDCWEYKAYVYNEPARNVYIETCMAFPRGLGSQGRAFHMADTLVHEACHRRHQHEGIVYPGGIWEEELECGKPQEAIRQLLDPADRYLDSSLGFDVEFVLARLRATNCFAKINSYEEFYRVLDNFNYHQGADFTC